MIMAAGLGTRLRPLTGLVSKPMVPVANRPVLEHILHLVRRYGIRDVIINLHYFPHAITSHLGDGSGMDMNIEYSFCLLYTSDAADEEDSVDLGGRRIIK